MEPADLDDGVVPLDLAAVRADTPGCVDRVFLDSAGASLMPRPVLDEVLGHLRRETEVGGYRANFARLDDLEAGYTVFAELLDCEPDDVAFTDSATRSWLSLLDAVPFEPGDRVLIGQAEYGANAVSLLRLAERAGVTIELVPSDVDGAFSVDALRDMLDERVKLVSLVHVPTNGGLVNPVAEVAAAVHEVGALVLLDACQSVGQLPVRLRESGVDMLTGTGRKWLRAPRGTGFLAVSRAARARLRPRLFDHDAAKWTTPWTYELREDARAYQLWECGVAERLGLIAAARYLLALGVDTVAAEVADRAERTRKALAEIPGVHLQDLGTRRCGLVTFTVDGHSPAEVSDALETKGVLVGRNLPNAARLDMDTRGLTELVRASPHYFVTPEQIETFADELRELRGRASVRRGSTS